MTAVGGTFYADRAQLQAWFDGAGPGQSAVYATGPALDPRSETVRTVVGWKDAGLVTCVQQRGRDGVLRYKICRLESGRPPAAEGHASANVRPAGSMPGGLGVVGSGGRGAPVDQIGTSESDLDRVYRLILRAAKLGADCPSNAGIAEALELDSRFHARRLFDRLVAHGHLRVVEGARFGARVVEVTASGARTGKSERVE